MALRVAVLGQLPETLLAQLSELALSLDLTILPQATTVPGAQQALSAPVPDIAVVGSSFTDGSAYAFLRALPPGDRPVGLVCVGSRDEEAVVAFELQATDFVLLPAPSARLLEAVSRARQQVLQLALLRTADELQRLLSEAGAAGGVDLSALFSARTGHGQVLAPDGLGANGEGARRRRAVGGTATGTLIASSPWRAPSRVTADRSGRARDGADEAILDLTQEDGGRAGSEARPLRVLVREGRRTRFVPLAEVDWFEADGNYIRVHTAGEKFRTRGTITAIESALDPRQFVRIHRRIVVNMDRVREMTPLPGGDGLLVLGDGATLRLSRTYRSRVR
ncbi:response regulator transcription factor [Gemmatimonas phototrophica]|uniref:response regulator transcription factor n=1 Tax=Gemmatimonas phototrophica TaxID=1379270 RepID=UPI0006A71AF3|nr:response regulator transcription factor [Gemmatimonas phototrophica]